MTYEITNYGDQAKLTINIEGISLEDAVKVVNMAKQALGISELDKTLINLINKGEGLLPAVKYYSDLTGIGLKESKQYCDLLKAIFCK